MMRLLPETAHWLWKIPLAGFAYLLGAMLGGAVVGALGLEMPSLPGVEVNASSQMALLLAGGAAMALGMAAMATGIAGRTWQRWTILTVFLVVVNGIGNALEGTIFTTVGGQWVSMLVNAFASALCAAVVCALFRRPASPSLASQVGEFRSRLRGTGLARRLITGLFAFPFFYFLFGMMIAPIVTPHYAELEFLTIPPMTTMLGVLFLRSAMFLAVSLAVVAAWSESRFRLVVGLGLAHFMAVGFVGLIQTTFFPAVLRWTHSIEILADSMFYAWALVWLFAPRLEAAEHHLELEEQKPEERFA